MRMWGVAPEKMCTKHLLGEHVELHMMVGSLRKGISMEGYYTKGLIDTRQIETRHEAIVQEMISRDIKHTSPLPTFDNPQKGFIDPQAASELFQRCERCRER